MGKTVTRTVSIPVIANLDILTVLGTCVCSNILCFKMDCIFTAIFQVRKLRLRRVRSISSDKSQLFL
jgi:hypothetical protein